MSWMHCAAADVDFITIGQYLQPTPRHAPIDRFVPPDEFEALAERAWQKGFLMVSCSPLTRSSHHAGEDFERLRAAASAKNRRRPGDARPIPPRPISRTPCHNSSKTMLVEASLDEIFDVIADMPFLPALSALGVVAHAFSVTTTRLACASTCESGRVRVKASFISDVELYRDKGEIISRLVSGALSELESRWTLTPEPPRADGSEGPEFTQIRYAVRYRLALGAPVGCAGVLA